jgi:hypothetical protein
VTGGPRRGRQTAAGRARLGHGADYGRYSSALARGVVASWPPAMSTIPFARTVAAATMRRLFMEPAGRNLAVDGSYSSGEGSPLPPATSTLPSAKRVAVATNRSDAPRHCLRTLAEVLDGTDLERLPWRGLDRAGFQSEWMIACLTPGRSGECALRGQAQSPEGPGTNAGPRIGGPDHTSRRPHERSTRTASPLASPPPLGSVFCQTSPA